MASTLLLLVLGQTANFTGEPNVSSTVLTINPTTFGDQRQNQLEKLPPASRDDYTYTPGIGYHKFHTTPGDWNTARRTCKEEGGHLAIINSVAESERIGQLFAKSPPRIAGVGDPGFAWIGVHSLFQQNEWVTVLDQSLGEAGFNGWNDGEPNDLRGDERCGTVVKSGKLNDDKCSKIMFGFVCELPQVFERESNMHVN